MKIRFVCLITIITLIVWPFFATADGGAIKPLPEGDWAWVDEDRQQAFINYHQGTEKLILGVGIEEKSSDVIWIMPVPGNPQQVQIDVTSELPVFFGDNVMSKAKLEISEVLENSYYAGLLGQLWTFPFGVVLVSMGGTRSMGGLGGEMAVSDLVSVEKRIEKAGMVVEVITAKDGRAIYNYFSQKGFDIKQGSISELDSYIEKEYSFVVSWISPEQIAQEKQEFKPRGIFISFPSSKIYYPLILTSAYGESQIPITIRVLEHVKPKIFSEIKPYTKVSYFTERTKKYGIRGAREARCKSDMAQLRTIMEMYYSEHGSYPTSLGELREDKKFGGDTQSLLKDIEEECKVSPSYSSKDKSHYTMKLGLRGGVYKIDSSGFYGFAEEKEELASSELKQFYGKKKPWKGEADYTKITIDAPAKLLKQDLWMREGRPLKIFLALWAVNNSLVVFALLYLLIVGITSFIAGGLAGLLCFRKFKKYALVGLANIATLLGLILVHNRIKKKEWEENRYSGLISFPGSFSIIFISLLSVSSLIFLLWRTGVEMDLLPVVVAGWVLINGAILLLIKFLLDKLGFKNKVVRAIFGIILFVALWAGIYFLTPLFLTRL